MGNVRKLELLPADKKAVESYDKWWTDTLRTHESFKDFGQDEAQRYEVMRPFREFVMSTYKIVEPVYQFWPHVLFELKGPFVKKGRE